MSGAVTTPLSGESTAGADCDGVIRMIQAASRPMTIRMVFASETADESGASTAAPPLPSSSSSDAAGSAAGRSGAENDASGVMQLEVRAAAAASALFSVRTPCSSATPTLSVTARIRRPSPSGLRQVICMYLCEYVSVYV